MGNKSICYCLCFFITHHYCIIFLFISSALFLVLTECMLVLVVFFFSLLPIRTTRQIMFSQNPETSKIRFLDSGFSPVSANSRIALSFDLRPSMNDRSKWKKTEGEGKKRPHQPTAGPLRLMNLATGMCHFEVFWRGCMLYILSKRLAKSCSEPNELVWRLGETQIVKRESTLSLFLFLTLFPTR